METHFIECKQTLASGWPCLLGAGQCIEDMLTRLRIAREPKINLAIAFAGQSKWIGPPHRIGRVLIDVDATGQPDRILADEATAAWIVIPMPVVVQPRLRAATDNLPAVEISCGDARHIHRRSGITR
jgi:hypothetical protein